MLSLLAEQNRRDGSARCAGSHAILVIHFLCARHAPRGSPLATSHRKMTPFLSPDARWHPSGDQHTVMTQVVCARPSRSGSWEDRSQKRTVESPEPEASWRPSGENATVRTASLCPVAVAHTV